MMYRVTIHSNGYIPFIGGNGPILVPITVPKGVYDSLKTLGYDVLVISKLKPTPVVKKEEVVEKVPEPEVPQEEDQNPGDGETEKDGIDNNELDDEVIINDPEYSPDAY